MEIEIAKVKVKRVNFRKSFDSGELQELKENLKERGQIHPIVVTTDNRLVAGERRLRAAKSLGWKLIRASVKEYDVTGKELDREIRKDGVFENIRRSSYTKSEEAKALAWLKENQTIEAKEGAPKERSSKKKVTKKPLKKKTFVKELAKKTGQSAATINTKVKLGEKMSTKVAAALDEGEISQRQAELIVRAGTKTGQDVLLEEIRGTKLSESRSIVAKALAGNAGVEIVPKKKIQGIEADIWVGRMYEKMEAVIEDVNHAFDVQAWAVAEKKGTEFFSRTVKFLKAAGGIKKQYVKAQAHKSKRKRVTQHAELTH